jgi:hypothetical protein
LIIYIYILDYVGGHAQQNGEQLNNLLKTLDGYYGNAQMKQDIDMPNKGEFIGYFIIFQVLECVYVRLCLYICVYHYFGNAQMKHDISKCQTRENLLVILS